jgi:hypothetical protein
MYGPVCLLVPLAYEAGLAMDSSMPQDILRTVHERQTGLNVRVKFVLIIIGGILGTY